MVEPFGNTVPRMRPSVTEYTYQLEPTWNDAIVIFTGSFADSAANAVAMPSHSATIALPARTCQGAFIMLVSSARSCCEYPPIETLAHGRRCNRQCIIT